jgi:threonine dehydratase
MTTTLESSARTETLDQQAPPTADAVQDYLNGLEPLLTDALPELHEMGVRDAEVFELPVEGPHRLLVLDASTNGSGTFKFPGVSFALKQTLKDNPATRTAVTGSAGNLSTALGEAGRALGVDVRAHTPADLNPSKEEAMRQRNVEIEKTHTDVMAAIEAARAEAANNDEIEFIHPFNHPYAIKGQQLLGRQIVKSLVDKGVNLQEDRVVALWQRGGGSGLAGTATEVYRQKEAGNIGDNFEVHEVRPERLADGSMNRRFDGLAVETPGSWSLPILTDKRFVQGNHLVSEEDTALAAEAVAQVSEVSYEYSALAGLAAALKVIRESNSALPVTYVTVLSGRNTAPGTAEYLKSLLVTSKEVSVPPAAAPALPRSVKSPVLSGPTAGYRQGLVDPIRRNGHSFSVSPEVHEAYRQQLSEWGVELLERR